MWKVRELADKVTNVVMNYTEIEAKVREATNDEAWGPTGTIKHELSQATFSYDQFPEVMGMLWKRIAENKRSPRRIYKSLLLLHHLLLNGSDRVIRATQDRIYELRSLTEYHVVYEPGFSLNSIIPPEVTKDGEMNVRVKAKEIVELVQDEERLREERKKAKKNRDKYVGIGSDRMMTSRWGSMSSDFDDMGEDLGRPKSPSLSTPSPKKESRKSTFEDAKPAVDLDDDFNPREGEDFGDFKTATTVAATKSAAGITEGAKSGGGDDIFAVDFNAAFAGNGGTNQPSVPPAAPIVGPASSQSLFSDNLKLIPPPATATAATVAPKPSPGLPQPPTNSVDLLGLDFDSAAPAAPTPSVLNSQLITPTATQTFSQPLTQNFQNSQPQQLMQPQQQQQNLMSLDNILQPVVKSNVQSNNINNNSTLGNKDSNALKGTTWGDLNISMGDLTINPTSRNPSANKVSMNQLKSMNK